MSQLDRIAAGLREAVAEGNFAEASWHLACQREALAQAGNPGDLATALETIEGLRRLLLAQLAHDQALLAGLRKPVPYAHGAEVATHSWELEG